MKNKKLITVGTGPTAMLAAIQLVDNDITDILMIEKGTKEGDVVSSWGGNGSRADGKNNLTHKVGGTLHDLIGYDHYYEYLEQQKNIWLRFAPTEEQKFNRNAFSAEGDIHNRIFKPTEDVKRLRAKALAHDVELDYYDILHLGSNNCYDICNNIYDYLISRGVEVLFETTVENVISEEDKIFRVITNRGEFLTENVLVAPGRSGSKVVANVARENCIKLENNGIDVGVRAEICEEIGLPLKDVNMYEPKFWKYSGKSKIKCRTFCYCPSNAYVVKEEYRDTGIMTVNGHSLSADGTSSGNLNFAILATINLTEPFRDAQGYAENFCKKVNMLAGQDVMVQRYGDLKVGRRTTAKKLQQCATIPSLDAEPASLDLAFAYRELDAIIDFIESLGNIIPGLSSDHLLLYAPEVKFYSTKVPLNENSMSSIPGLYFGGDGSGHTRGLNQASIQGLVIGDSIIKESSK